MDISQALPEAFPGALAMVSALEPREPVYCLYPHVLAGLARRFLDGFPGRVLYAVKANPHPGVLTGLHGAGIRDFDTASVPEVKLVHAHCPGAECHFMAPIRLRGAAAEAYRDFGVKAFVVDHADGLAGLLTEVEASEVTIFVRMACHDPDATYNLSTKFGASPEETLSLLHAVRDAGGEPALAFNAGSLVLKPAAYARALDACSDVLARADVVIRRLDVGGGFPSSYPGLGAASLDEFFATIREVRAALPLHHEAELLAEPGRALVAEGLSVVTQVLLRKDRRLYLNDGIWGSFIEPVLSKGLVRYPTRVYRRGEILDGKAEHFTLYGPTCDSFDTFPAPFPLPAGIEPGDWVEFGMMGAYTITNRTGFNGFYPDRFVTIDDPEALPPGLEGSHA